MKTKPLAPDAPLRREMSLVLILKCCALALLWWLFVRDTVVPVDAARVAAAQIPAVHTRSSP